MANISPDISKLSFRTYMDLDELERARTFDERIFLGQAGIDTYYLKEVARYGCVYGVEKPDKTIVALGMVVCRRMTIPGAEPLVQTLSPTTAYMEGLAVDPDYRGNKYGLADMMLGYAHIFAERNWEKSSIISTIRPENYESIATFLRNGYLITDYREGYYPNMPNGLGDRFVVKHGDLSVGREKLGGWAQQTLDMNERAEVRDIRKGNAADPEARIAVRGLLRAGYCAYSAKTDPNDRMRFNMRFARAHSTSLSELGVSNRHLSR